jgi:Flp pilus assembly protein TadD
MRRILLCVTLALAAAAPDAWALPKEKDRWIEVRTENFILFSNARETLTRGIGLNLERLRKALSLLSDDLRVNSPLSTHIYVFKGHGSFGKYVDTGDTLNPTVGLFASHRDGNYVAINAARGVNPSEIIYHEYLHYYLNNNTTAQIPVWFDEGLAEFYSTFAVRENQVDIGRPVQRHMTWLRSHPLLELDRLFAIERDSAEYNEGNKNGAFYAQSWAVVHILFGGKSERWPQLVRFLELLEDGASVDEALATALGTTKEQLAEDLERFIRADELPYTRYTFKDLGINEEVEIAPMSRPDVLYRLGDYLAHAEPDRTAEAEEHFRAALKIIPEHPGAIAGLGFIRDLDGELDEASKFYQWALELDADNYLTHFLLAQNLVERYYRRSDGKVEPGAALPRDLARARELYRATLQLNPGLAAAYAGFGYTYIYDPGDPAPGVRAMARAHEMLPHDEEITYGLMLLYLKNGDREAAERLERQLSRSSDRALVALASEALLNDDLDSADRAINEQRLNEGLDLIRKVLAETDDPALQEELRRRAAEIEVVIEKNRVIFLYNEAADLATQGHLTAAEEKLDRVLAETDDPELLGAAEELKRVIAEQRVGP